MVEQEVSALVEPDAGNSQPSAEQAPKADTRRFWSGALIFRAQAQAPPTEVRHPKTHPAQLAALIILGVALGIVVGLYAHRVILGVIVISLVLTLCNQLLRVWTEHEDRDESHP